MPQLPTAMIVPKSRYDDNALVHSSRHRLALSRKDTICLSRWSRALKGASHFQTVEENDCMQSELAYKRLYFETMDRLALKGGFKINAAEMFMQSYFEGVWGSQTILQRAKFSNGFEGRISPSESTTPYRFYFEQVSRIREADDVTVMQPIYLVDDQVLRELEDAGIRKADTNRFFEIYMKMSGLAEHDYLHGMVLNALPMIGYNMVMLKEMYYKSAMEKHALATHACVIRETFRENPRRKEFVLDYAREGFGMVRDFQKKLLKKAQDQSGRTVALHVGTYLAETFAHRLFRVVAPNDPDLASVKDVMNEIHIVCPEEMTQEPCYRDDLLPCEKLGLNVAWSMRAGWEFKPGAYEDIFETREVDVVNTSISSRAQDVIGRKSLFEVLEDAQRALVEHLKMCEVRWETLERNPSRSQYGRMVNKYG